MVGKALYIGDLHLGNIYSDILGFIELLEKAKQDKYEEVILEGDVVDGLDKYNTQKYKQMPDTLITQQELLKWLIEFIQNNIDTQKIVFVIGNHEKDSRGSIIDFEMLQKVYGITIARHYYDCNNMINIHQLAKSARVGSQSGWTPSLVDKAKTMLVYYTRIYGDVRGIVTAHVHKIFAYIQNMDWTFILLPAFLKSGRDTAEDLMFPNTIISMDKDTVIKYSGVPHLSEEVEKFTMLFYTKVMINRKQLLTFQSIYELADEALGTEARKKPNSKARLMCYKTETGTEYCVESRMNGKYIIYMTRNGKTYKVTELPAIMVNSIWNLYRQGYDKQQIQYMTGINRRYIGILAKALQWDELLGVQK
jgi:UDP-2,3-diacylglucosamine pyrophosphatase LpxH